MSGIAELLANLGYVVSGSDLKRTSVTERLETLGIRVAYGHDAANVGGADVLVMSSAVRAMNPELVEARRRRVPVIPRAEMLAELMRLRFGVAVAGAHGKTTVTSMTAVVLERCGLDPTAVIGGRLSAFGSNARLGRSDVMVAEADESDRSFLKLSPTVAVITNIDDEHLENYSGFDDLVQAFVAFANAVPFYGRVVACLDNPPVAAMLPRVSRPVTTYGLASDADVMAAEIELEPLSSRAVVTSRGANAGQRVTLGRLSLQVPGRHNLLNALAAIAVGMELDLPFERIEAALRGFRGVERRFQIHGEATGVLVVDDYAHHPTEIAAVMEVARRLDRRVIVAFQPHRFTRTAMHLDGFGPALAGADRIVLTDIYGAGEDPMPGVTVEALAAAIRRGQPAPVEVVSRLDDLVPALARAARPGDVILTLGAGSIAAVPGRLVDALKKTRV
jgi:UDP-N-acetylmuramate--alanine ligase